MKKKIKKPVAIVSEAPLLKLDLGCGQNKVGPEWKGVDRIKFEGVDLVLDLCAKSGNSFKPWPWETNSVDQAHTSHFVEHLDADERIHFVNELFRVLKPNAECKLIVPSWSSSRAYGDLTHKWPPVSEFWFYYLTSEWRKANAPHNDGYTCNFEATWGYGLNQGLMSRNQEYQLFALANFKDAATDIIATLTKRV